MSLFFLYTHVLSGSIALISILMALVYKKGSKKHRQFGKSYVFSMVVALIAAASLSLLTSNLFLLLVALFSSYLVYTGWRLAANREQSFTALDKFVVGFMLLSAIFMLGTGVWMYIHNNDMATVISVFGLIGGGFSLVDAGRLKKKIGADGDQTGWPIGRERIVLHITRIGGASIATITAVFVVNIQTNPAFIAWLLPTALSVRRWPCSKPTFTVRRASCERLQRL